MRLAVAQLAAEDDREADLRLVLEAVRMACEGGAEAVVLPRVPSLAGDEDARRSMAGVEACSEGFAVLAPSADPSLRSEPGTVETVLGRTLVLDGDDTIDPALYGTVREHAPDALVLRPEPESALQAEAVLELALAYSTSLAGLVVVSSLAAQDPAGGSYGGSAIVQHGEVLAEAVDPSEVIFADVYPPVRLQQPVSPLPEPPLILRQRLAHHRGTKAEVDWLADLD